MRPIPSLFIILFCGYHTLLAGEPTKLRGIALHVHQLETDGHSSVGDLKVTVDDEGIYITRGKELLCASWLIEGHETFGRKMLLRELSSQKTVSEIADNRREMRLIESLKLVLTSQIARADQ